MLRGLLVVVVVLVLVVVVVVVLVVVLFVVVGVVVVGLGLGVGLGVGVVVVVVVVVIVVVVVVVVVFFLLLLWLLLLLLQKAKSSRNSAITKHHETVYFHHQVTWNVSRGGKPFPGPVIFLGSRNPFIFLGSRNHTFSPSNLRDPSLSKGNLLRNLTFIQFVDQTLQFPHPIRKLSYLKGKHTIFVLSLCLSTLGTFIGKEICFVHLYFWMLRSYRTIFSLGKST